MQYASLQALSYEKLVNRQGQTDTRIQKAQNIIIVDLILALDSFFSSVPDVASCTVCG